MAVAASAFFAPDGTGSLGMGANGLPVGSPLPSPEALMYMVLVRGVAGSDAALADGSFVHGNLDEAPQLGAGAGAPGDAEGSDLDSSSFGMSVPIWFQEVETDAELQVVPGDGASLPRE